MRVVAVNFAASRRGLTYHAPPRAQRRGKDRRVRARLVALLATLPLAGGVAASACSPSPDQGTIAILTVDDPFVGPPAASTLTVESIGYDDGGADGAVTVLARASAASGTLDLGTHDETDTESLLVTATDAQGSLVAKGRTLPIQLGAIAGLTLGVFVQRTGTLSRMPSALGDGRPAPNLNIVGGRYVFVTGGGDPSLVTQTRLYDLIAWAPLGSPPTLPIAAESTVIAQPTEGDFQALAIGSSGAAWYDLTSSGSADASVPATAGAWADVAGGATITATDSSVSFVVGATRTTGSPTSAVLVVPASGSLSWATLSTPRLGATAAWVDALGGIVVEGGNVTTTSTSSAPQVGAEIVYASSSSKPIALGYPPDTTTGAAMVGLDPGHVLVVGGGNGSVGGNAARVFTVPCDGVTTPCAMTTWPTTLPTALTAAQAFSIDSATAFVVGDDPSGATHAYTLSQVAAVEVPLRLPRVHARAIRLPIGAPGTGPIALVGGDADAGANTGYMESFIP
jgi:hypothetical protein